jgi:UDP-3-O-[3-hydroxymyristoyl] glucosamine N-acyltransferase
MFCTNKCKRASVNVNVSESAFVASRPRPPEQKQKQHHKQAAMQATAALRPLCDADTGSQIEMDIDIGDDTAIQRR